MKRREEEAEKKESKQQNNQTTKTVNFQFLCFCLYTILETKSKAFTVDLVISNHANC